MVDVTSSNGYQLNGGNKLNITGAIYMPRRQFTYNSGSESSTSATNGFNPGFNFVVGSMHINNGSTLRIEPTDLTPVAPGSGRGEGVDDGGGVDVERVSSSEGLPFLAE